VLAETKSLKIIAGQWQELQKQGSRKQSSSNPDQGSSHKRLKASQPIASPDPEIFSAFKVEIGPMDSFEPTPEPKVRTPSYCSNPVEPGCEENLAHNGLQLWGAWQDNSQNDDNVNGGEDDNEDDDEEDNDNDNDNDKNEILGLSFNRWLWSV